MPAPRRSEPDSAARPSRAERRRKLVDCARELFAEQGFAATDLDDICEAAEVTPARLRVLFKTKSEILAAIIADLVQHAFPPLEETEGPPPDVLDLLFNAVKRMLTVARMEFRVFARSLADLGDDEEAAALRHGSGEIATKLAEIITIGQQSGVLRRVPDAKMAAYDLLQMLVGYLLLEPVSPGLPEGADLPGEILDGFLQGLLKTDI